MEKRGSLTIKIDDEIFEWWKILHISYTMMGGRDENILNKCEMFVNSLIEKFGK